jgi:hypothetical protein
MLFTIFLILAILWVLGLLGHIAGGFINILLVIALIVLIYDLATRNRRV